MSVRGSKVAHDLQVEHPYFDQKSINQSKHSADADFALLQEQLRLAKAATVLQGVGHGLGDQKAASLASNSSSSTPSLVYDAKTPDETSSVS